MFIDEKFLLNNKVSQELFNDYAKDQPIIDYHCHLSPDDIYNNRNYDNLTQVWLNDKGVGDHYKWRLLRANGVPEELISGNGDDHEKFLAFVKTLEKAIGNPIYEWSHLELRRYFGIDLVINEENAEEIWSRANEKLQSPEFKPKKMIENMNVRVVCTTDDPVSDLSTHKKLAEENNKFKVLPTFRPDKTWTITSADYANYVQKISEVSGIKISNFSDFKKALAQRVDYFHSVGGRLADQGLNSYYYAAATDDKLNRIFIRALSGEHEFTDLEVNQFTTAIQLCLMSEYTKHNWVMQMHINALRNDSSTILDNVGVDAGGDSMGDQVSLASNIVHLLDDAQSSNVLPKAILYSLNPNDWTPLATAIQSFQGGMVQKLQLGCAWWFNDTFEGMKEQLTVMAEQSLLANFTGMLTDSRSFLSYPRHEYFRRVLCQLIGEWVEQGRIPNDTNYLGKIIEDICYNNAHEYFGFFD